MYWHQDLFFTKWFNTWSVLESWPWDCDCESSKRDSWDRSSTSHMAINLKHYNILPNSYQDENLITYYVRGINFQHKIKMRGIHNNRGQHFYQLLVGLSSLQAWAPTELSSVSSPLVCCCSLWGTWPTRRMLDCCCCVCSGAPDMVIVFRGPSLMELDWFETE